MSARKHLGAAWDTCVAGAARVPESGRQSARDIVWHCLGHRPRAAEHLPGLCGCSAQSSHGARCQMAGASSARGWSGHYCHADGGAARLPERAALPGPPPSSGGASARNEWMAYSQTTWHAARWLRMLRAGLPGTWPDRWKALPGHGSGPPPCSGLGAALPGTPPSSSGHAARMPRHGGGVSCCRNAWYASRMPHTLPASRQKAPGHKLPCNCVPQSWDPGTLRNCHADVSQKTHF